MFVEFREFINRGSFIDLAVGFVMGVAVTGVVTALVQRVIMPVIGLIFGQPNFDQVWTFGETVDGVPAGSVGAVITALVTFLVVALVLFFIIKGYNRMQRAEPDQPEPAAEPEEVVLLREILAQLRAQQPGGA